MRNDINIEDCIKLYDGGMSTRQVAEKLNCSTKTIFNRLRSVCHPKRRMTGPQNPSWKGGRVRINQGYMAIKMPSHPKCPKSGYVREHILNWEQFHQKPVPIGYCIHHLNGIKDDNRPENLIAMKRGEHTDQTKPYRERINELEKILITYSKIISILISEKGGE